MAFLQQYGLFLAQTVTIVVAILLTLAGIIVLTVRSRHRPQGRIQVRHLNRRYEEMALALRSATQSKKVFKQTLKAFKRHHKGRQNQERRRVYVLDFEGDIRASALGSLREEISAVLAVARPEDEVVVRLESGGGMVHAYGLAASQLDRVRARGVRLTVTVDKIAASGGYMMACVADRLIAAPFAIIGSIGVVAQLPNFHRLLKKHDVDYELFTAGDYKRTVTVFGEITNRGREKFQADIEDAHRLFKDFINQHRPDLDVERVSTGEYWFGSRALEHRLVDALGTSDDYLLEASREADLYRVHYHRPQPVMARLGVAAARLLGRGEEERLPQARL